MTSKLAADAPTMNNANDRGGQKQSAAPRGKAGYGRAAQAVFWSFFGVRKHRHYAEDLESLSILQVLIAGVLGALVFIAVLVGIVVWVTA